MSAMMRVLPVMALLLLSLAGATPAPPFIRTYLRTHLEKQNTSEMCADLNNKSSGNFSLLQPYLPGPPCSVGSEWNTTANTCIRDPINRNATGNWSLLSSMTPTQDTRITEAQWNNALMSECTRSDNNTKIGCGEGMTWNSDRNMCLVQDPRCLKASNTSSRRLGNNMVPFWPCAHWDNSDWRLKLGDWQIPTAGGHAGGVGNVARLSYLPTTKAELKIIIDMITLILNFPLNLKNGDFDKGTLSQITIPDNDHPFTQKCNIKAYPTAGSDNMIQNRGYCGFVDNNYKLGLDRHTFIWEIDQSNRSPCQHPEFANGRTHRQKEYKCFDNWANMFEPNWIANFLCVLYPAL